MDALVKSNIQKVRDLIASGWCQGAYALDADGRPVDQRSTKAVAWCLLGAIDKVMDTASFHSLSCRSVYEPISCRIGYGSLTNFNDRSTQEDVLALLDGLLTEPL